MSKQKVLIAEDDVLIGDMLAEVLDEHGYEVPGVARTVGEAMALWAEHRPGLAAIDVRLAGGDLGTEIAARVARFSRMGVLYACGDGSDDALAGAVGEACITKPYGCLDIARGLEIVSGIVRTGVAKPPFPMGFRLLPTHPSGRADAAMALELRRGLRA